MKHTDPNYVDPNYVRERFEMFPNNPAYRYLAQAHGVIPYPTAPKPETFGDIRDSTDAEHAKANAKFQADIDALSTPKEPARE